jgi:hypothetical protein
MKLNLLDTIALILVIIGGLNWGLTAFGYNLVSMIFGTMSWLESLIYILVGLSAIYLAIIFPKIERR